VSISKLAVKSTSYNCVEGAELEVTGLGMEFFAETPVIWKSEDVISPKSIGSDELAQATPNEIDNTIKISDIVNILLKFIISSSLMIVYEILLINV
jgi:hypothetical protein